MKVAVLKGGRSSEHEVSLNSGASVAAQLRDNGHEVIEVLLTKDGRWLVDEKDVELKPGAGLLGVDVVFPVLHGPYGEDGTVQGLLDLLDVPYVGCGVAASAVCMNKLLFKDLMHTHGIPQVAYFRVSEESWQKDQDELQQQAADFGWPVFVKPARLGSSVGISKVHGPEEFAPAVELALKHDAAVIGEAMSEGKEVECSILGTVERFASVPGEIVLTTAEWYDYEAKYTDGGMELRVPAEISSSAAKKVQEIAREAFHRTGCAGLARVDFFVDGETVLVSEINTIPGFTQTSVYGKLLEASGVPYAETLERLLEDAKQRYQQERAKHY